MSEWWLIEKTFTSDIVSSLSDPTNGLLCLLGKAFFSNKSQDRQANNTSPPVSLQERLVGESQYIQRVTTCLNSNNTNTSGTALKHSAIFY